MKKYITWEQFNQLDEKEKKELLDDIYGNFGDDEYKDPILSIGDLFEFLHNTEEQFHIDNDLFEWQVEYSENFYRETELCDALWKAVKAILEK